MKTSGNLLVRCQLTFLTLGAARPESNRRSTFNLDTIWKNCLILRVKNMVNVKN